MTPLDDPTLRIVALGAGATATMDLWQVALRFLGVPASNFGLLGRWIGHMARGQWRHAAIAQAAPVRGEHSIGWTAHYLVGIAFAAAWTGLVGTPWLLAPTLCPALLFGIGTVLFPLLVMQPAMGAGMASTRTTAPLRNSLKSLVNHTVFGFGLYLSAWAISHTLGPIA